MSRDLAVPALTTLHGGRLNLMIVLRIALAAVALCILLSPAVAGQALPLRAEVTVGADVLTLADLVDGAPAPAAATPLFRAPALGETGTIQTARVAEAARRYGLALDAAGRREVVVTRAARRIAAPEIEQALRRALELQHGVDARAASILFDGAPTFVVAPENEAPVTIETLSFDRRSRRFHALVSVVGGSAGKKATAVLGGSVRELVEVGVLGRAVNRGDIIHPGDITLERRPREIVPNDLQPDMGLLAGRVARRALAAGAVLRMGDLGKPEIVARGDAVTVVYEIPGMTLTLRGRAMEAGAQGDTIAITNLQSKRTLQATVVAPGRVSVLAAVPGPVAANVVAHATSR